MAIKGAVNTTVSRSALNEIIVYMNQYKTQISEKVTLAQNICQRLLDDESLKGGDGDQIREGLKECSVGLSNLAMSVNRIIKALNNNLGATMDASQGKFGAAASEEMKKNAAKTGVLAHKE